VKNLKVSEIWAPQASGSFASLLIYSTGFRFLILDFLLLNAKIMVA